MQANFQPAASGAVETTNEVALKSAPKVTRPESPSRRDDDDDRTVEKKIGRRLDAFPDKIDLEDWPYRPTLQALPVEVNDIHLVPAVLDQGREGACTGYALAAVINYLLKQSGIARTVSPRMLYELARRYDEWPGENYEGSSARGAMKAWVRHGVCTDAMWPASCRGTSYLTAELCFEAVLSPGGAYYRVDFRQIRHIHAAISEVGIVYATLMVHEGWDKPGDSFVEVKSGQQETPLRLPIIERKGVADGGHAIAIVGYTNQGFIVQNSWGTDWGKDGFALLPYEDFMLHATDVWVAQLGVPVTADLWESGAADVRSGLFRAGEAISLQEVRPYVINIGNDGVLSDRGDYWTTPEDLHRLFRDTIPKKTKGWSKRRVMFFLHGGLNSEVDAAKRVIAYRDVCLENEIYPLHVMWESDWFTTTKNLIEDHFNIANERAEGRFLDHLREARDRVFELTVAYPGSKLWKEMKENAALASHGRKGGIKLLVDAVKAAKNDMREEDKAGWELHVVAHSAGAIMTAHATSLLLSIGIPWLTTQFMAPALRVDHFKDLMAQHVIDKKCPQPTLYLLSKVGELDDDVGPYGKSLLYLISNALESRRETPLLGMEKYLVGTVGELLSSPINALPGIVVAGVPGVPGAISRSDTHGGFDNDPDTLNSVLVRILGQLPRRAFTDRDLRF
jgi:hypothetical protein